MAGNTPNTDCLAVMGATGALGHALALRCGHAGIRVGIGSRDSNRAESALEAALEACPEGDFFSGENAQVAAQGDIVALCVPFATQAQALRALKDAWRPGQILLDTTVPLATAVGGKPTRLVGVWQGSAAEQAADMVPMGVEVVSALHTVSAKHLADASYRFDEDTFLCGDGGGAKDRVASLIASIPGLRPLDVGPLELSRVTEQLTPLLISVNRRYAATAGIRIANLT